MNNLSEIKIVQIIKTAIRNNSFTFVYQPIYNIETGIMEKIELLIRLKDNKFGIIQPNIFIPIAEEYNLLYRISDIVFEEACKAVKILINDNINFGKVCINVSLLHLKRCNFVKNTKAILDKYNISPNRICIEVIENSNVKDLEESKNVLNELSKIGIEIAIDDFGREYSNIDINKSVNITEPIYIDDIDLCGLLGNLLDNAIEACERTESNRFINIKIITVKNNLIILIQNSMSGNI